MTKKYSDEWCSDQKVSDELYSDIRVSEEKTSGHNHPGTHMEPSMVLYNQIICKKRGNHVDFGVFIFSMLMRNYESFTTSFIYCQNVNI